MYIPPHIKRKLWQMYLFVLALAGVVIWSSVAHAPDHLLHFYTLNIGQGDSLYIRLPDEKDIVIDGGPDDSVLGQLGQVMPLGDRDIDLVIATHNHADHITGLTALLKKYNVHEIWLTGAIHNTDTFTNWLQAVKDEQSQGANVEKVKAGKTADFDGVQLTTLFPFQDYEGKMPQDQHDATIVTSLKYGDVSMLLTGDLNEGHEAQMLETEKDTLRAQVLKVPHHGSATGLTNEFLSAVSPQTAIISVGAHNQFHHPAPSIIDKLKARAVETFRTDQNGRVEVVSDGKSYWVNKQK